LSTELSPNSRNFNLDVVRGLAILMVIVHHIALPFRLSLRDGLLDEWLGRRAVSVVSFSGYEAVMMFFVLSGFLIARRCIERYGSLDRIAWRDFYWRRARRIVPLLAVLLIVISALHGLQVPHFTINKEGQTWLGALFSAIFLHLNWYEGQTTWLPAAWDVLWSLSIEEVFYLTFPWLCIFLRGRWLLVAMLLLAASLPITRGALSDQGIWQEKAYLPGFAAIACGVSAALIADACQHRSMTFWRCLAWIGCGAFACSFVFGVELWFKYLDSSVLMHCTAVAVACLGLHALKPARWQQISFGWLARMGQLSYELYLTHMLVVIPAVALVQTYLSDYAYWYFLMLMPITAICFVFAKLVARFVSEPLAQRYFSGTRQSA
jgi:peptidoglycan/LPS O-acetylase OafA/YrhL